MSEKPSDVVVVGAGPYGLSAVAHLRAAGVETRVFGEPMVFWEQQMPLGMLLRSAWEASHIADPHHRYTLEAYQAATGARFGPPVPLNDFVRYGRWFQQQVAPDLDHRRVTRVTTAASGWTSTTARSSARGAWYWRQASPAWRTSRRSSARCRPTACRTRRRSA